MNTKRWRDGLAPVWLLAIAACTGPTSEELLSDAQQAITAGEHRTAEIHLKNLLQQEPNNATARHLLGEVFLAQRDFAAAEHHLRIAAELGADVTALQLPLLRALVGQAKFAEVLEQIEAGPELSGDNRAAELALAGTAQRGLGALDRAEAAYRSALDMTPSALDV